jgi:hypothetical protein
VDRFGRIRNSNLREGMGGDEIDILMNLTRKSNHFIIVVGIFPPFFFFFFWIIEFFLWIFCLFLLRK